MSGSNDAAVKLPSDLKVKAAPAPAPAPVLPATPVVPSSVSPVASAAAVASAPAKPKDPRWKKHMKELIAGGGSGTDLISPHSPSHHLTSSPAPHRSLHSFAFGAVNCRRDHQNVVCTARTCQNSVSDSGECCGCGGGGVMGLG